MGISSRRTPQIFFSRGKSVDKRAQAVLPAGTSNN